MQKINGSGRPPWPTRLRGKKDQQLRSLARPRYGTKLAAVERVGQAFAFACRARARTYPAGKKNRAMFMNLKKDYSGPRDERPESNTIWSLSSGCDLRRFARAGRSKVVARPHGKKKKNYWTLSSITLPIEPSSQHFRTLLSFGHVCSSA